MRFFSKLRHTSVSQTSSKKETASMIRSTRLARWALGLMVLLAGSASLPAVDLYVTGWDSDAQKNIFGKINSATGLYTELNSDIGGGFNFTYGLAWNPGIGKFNTLRQDGSFSTITTTGTVGSVIASGLNSYAYLAYNQVTSTMYDASSFSFNTVNPATGAESYIGLPAFFIDSQPAFVNGTMYAAVDIGNSVNADFRFGLINNSTVAFTPVTTSNDFSFAGMRLVSDGTSLFGLKNNSLNLIDPSTGAISPLIGLTGFGNRLVFGMSVPVAVPEPSTYALAAIATSVMAAIARRRKARRA
jgi:hypothetical protein